MIAAFAFFFVVCNALVLCFFAGAGGNRECDLEEQGRILNSSRYVQSTTSRQ